MEKYN